GLVDADRRRVVTASGAAAAILGSDLESLLGMRAAEFLGVTEDGSPLPIDDRPYSRAIATRRAVRKFVIGFVRPDGQRRWAEADAVPLLAPDGSVERVISAS